MDKQIATLVILIMYIGVMIGIGIYTARRTKSTEDFMLGGRSVGPWLTAFGYGTTYFSAVVFIGYAGQFGWSYGVSAAWIGVGNALLGSMLPWIILGKRTRLMTNHLGAKTMPDYFEKRYDSSLLKTVSAAIVFIFLIPYTASVYNGLAKLFQMVLGLGEGSDVWIVVAMAALSAVYVILGGYAATALNDFFQGMIMLVGIITVVVCVLNGKGGFSSAVQQLGEIEAQKGLDTLFGPDPINLLGVVILTSIGTWGLPQMVAKFYAIKSEKAIAKGTVISTIFALIVAGGSYFMGGFIRLYCTTTGEEGKAAINVVNGKPVFDTMVPSMLQEALPDILIGLVVVLVLSASMSTLSSLVLTSSSTLTNDLIKPHVKNFHDKKQMLTMRIMIAVFLLVSVIIACNKNASISTLMSYSWGALSGAFLGPFMYGLFNKKTSKAAVLTSFCTGVGITVVHMVLFNLGIPAFDGIKAAVSGLPIAITSPINAGAFAMIVSVAVVPLVSCFTKSPKTEVVENAFSCLEKKI